MSEVARSIGRTLTQQLTRPADTTAYTAGTVVADLKASAIGFITFPQASSDPYGVGIIQEAILSLSANVATKPDVELWLFDTAPAVTQDNATPAWTAADLRNLVGIIPFSTTQFYVGNPAAGASGNCANEQKGLGLAFNTKASGTGGITAALYGVFVVRNAYVPTSAEVWTIRLKVLD